MKNQERNRSVKTMAAAERAHQRATGGGLGDVAIFILMRSCNIMMSERASRQLEPHGLTAMGYITMMSLYSRPENQANPSELSEVTGETRGNMTRICEGARPFSCASDVHDAAAPWDCRLLPYFCRYCGLA